MPASRYTPEQRTEALKLYETAGPTAVTEKLGIPKQTVMSWAKKAGVRTVRTARTREATEAVVADAKARRARITERLYKQSEQMLDLLEAAEFQMLVRGSGGAEFPETLDFIPAAERRTLIQSINTATQNAANLEKLDSDTDTAATDSVVDQLLDGFRRQVGQ